MSSRLVACLLCGLCACSLAIFTFLPKPDRALATSHSAAPLNESMPVVVYDRDVLPILSSKCFACHGPDKSARKGALRLDRREFALRAARSGDIPIQPGQASKSEVFRRVCTDDETTRMPPVKTGSGLTASERDILRRWIDQGAEYRLHWAFLAPARPTAPEVMDKAWVKNDIDAFILRRLEQAGLAPAPPADRVTLMRRLSLDLRGLPPSLDEVDQFLADGSPDAYEKLVERMLASPHFGEKMAQTWLDLARFGDTSGYHFDSIRQMWLWRDWVINAYNANMPFDQFTIEQLAGDLLPDATVAQRIASGFNRNTRFNEEGGVDPEEYVIRYTVDRTNTLGQVWLGLTLQCAECHGHKYDPISHREYYQLYAFFTGITEPMTSGNHDQPLEPILKVPAPEQLREIAGYREQIGIVNKAIDKELERFVYNDPEERASKSPHGAGDETAYLESQTAWESVAKANSKLPAEVYGALQVEPSKRNPAQEKTVRDYYLRRVYSGARDIFDPLEKDIEDLSGKIKKVEEAIPHTLISKELAKPRPAHVLIRGDFQQKGERVVAGVPAAFPPLPQDAPATRLGLARWLVRPDHPLTSRVMANRLWAQMFGEGLVRSLADFGSQGDYPSHPELLDWIASEFAGAGAARPWDVKGLLRTMALSSTYRQSSRIDSTAAMTDPANRLLSRARRNRLTAEEIRDSALAIAGLLNQKVGGPSFMPYQPTDFYMGKNENWKWSPGEGEEQYRRGLYAFWRRNALHPMFAILDAPSREECAVQRQRSNTPLQALVTLNAPSLVEAARVFAQRILTEGPRDLSGRLAFAFRASTCRLPTDDEMKVLHNRYQSQLRRFEADTGLASSLVNAGQYPRDAGLPVAEHAAWTAVANLLLNLDEVLTRE